MKSFSFRLDSILNYRDYLEKRAQIELFKANQELSEKKEAIKRLNKKRLEKQKNCTSEGYRVVYVQKNQM